MSELSGRRHLCFFSIGIFVLISALAVTVPVMAGGDEWKDDWQVVDGFRVSIDAEGFDLPTSIAFVPNPGPNPKDPLYFVTEVRGKIKVVTNDRSVFTFAENFFQLEVEEELPGRKGEAGMAGLCLEPETGYVFVTFNYQDEYGVLRNCVVRFGSKPHTFATEAGEMTSFAEIFSDHASAISHMIGPCVAKDGQLFVSVGDSRSPANGQDLDVPMGKILRMTYDGKPVPGNPFYVDDDIKKARNYVWAWGVRNPFSLSFAGDTLYCGDNGPNVDRIIRVEPGRNYQYDGSNWSIGTNAQVVFSPAVSPVQMGYLPKDRGVFPASYESRFYLALSGFVEAAPGVGQSGQKSVVSIEYDESEGRIVARPQLFLQYRGMGRQLPVGCAVGPDGIYVAPLLAVKDGKSAILKVTHEPEVGHPWVIGRDPHTLMDAKGCLGCHSFDPYQQMRAPTFERERLVAALSERLNSFRYEEKLAKIDALDLEPFKSYQYARDEVRAATGLEKVRLWIKYQTLEPKFDDASSAMPSLGVTEAEADMLAEFLVSESNQMSAVDQLKYKVLEIVPQPRLRHLAFSMIIGFGIGVVFVMILAALRSRFRKKRAAQVPDSWPPKGENEPQEVGSSSDASGGIND